MALMADEKIKIKIALIGETPIIMRLLQIIRKSFPNIKPFYVSYNPNQSINSMKPAIERTLKICDGVLYTDVHYFGYFYSCIKEHDLPSRYLDFSHTDIILGLFRASNIFDLDISKISIDAQNKALLEEIYSALKTRGSVRCIEYPVPDLDIEHLVKSHTENYQYSGYLPVTIYAEVYGYLREANIPAVLIDMQDGTLASELKNLLMLCQAKFCSEARAQVAIIYTYIFTEDYFYTSNENQIKEVVDTNRVNEILILFSQKINGALFPISNNQSVIVCNDIKLLEEVTNNFTNLSIVSDISHRTVFNISFGIGYGDTALEARKNAMIAVNHSLRLGGNSAYLVKQDNSIMGPLGQYAGSIKPSKYIYDDSLLQISKNTSLSVNTISKLQNIAAQKQSKTFTSAELADGMGTSVRTVNRIVEKLLDEQYVEIVGQHLVNRRGRPSRIIKILF